MSEARHVLTILAVEQLDVVLAFYRAAFEWPLIVDVPVYKELELPGGRRLGLYEREGFARNVNQPPAITPPGAISATELYFSCDDLEAQIARLEKAGARLLSPLAPRLWGDEVAYFADPAGNVIAVARELE